MVPKDRKVNTRRILDCVNASFCPPPRLVLRGMFLLSHFCSSAKVSKMLLITKTVPDGGKSNYREGKKNKTKPTQQDGRMKEKVYVFFPWMSVHYQPDTITSRVISLQSLKYQNKRKAAHKQKQKQKPKIITFSKEFLHKRGLVKESPSNSYTVNCVPLLMKERTH